MKLIVFLILVFSLRVSADAKAQKISLELRNTTLENAFEEIRKQSPYDFVYHDKFINKAKPITLSLHNADIEETLVQLFKDQPFRYEMVDNIITIQPKVSLSARGKTVEAEVNEMILAFAEVKGKVVDSLGRPLAGATVKVKGFQLATKTDRNGEFVMKNVPEDAVLEISYLGFVKMEVKAKAEMGTVVLKLKVGELDGVEVMVSTGYQQIPKERATGSFSYIDNKTFNQQVGTTIMERLEAVGNGIVVDRTYGANPVIMVRGLSTIQGPREPLIVVDNFPYEGNINNINPNDVESITILKDAAAASIWGARAGNGVIIITTKKGRYDQPTSINLNANVSVGAKPDLFKTTLVSSAGFVEFEKFLYEKEYYNSKINQKPSSEILSPVVELLIKRDKAVTEAEREAIDQKIDRYKDFDLRDDMMKYLYHNKVNQQYALNMQGGTKNFAWTGSANYDSNKDELQEKYKRINIQYKQMFQPISDLSIQTSIYFTQTNQKNGAKGYGNVTTISNGIFPYTRLVDDNGQAIGLDKAFRSAWTETTLNGQGLDWKYYPLEDWKYDTRTTQSYDILANTGINYKIIPSLAFDFKYQYEKQLQEQINLQGVNSWTSRTTINMYSTLKPDGTLQYGYPFGGKYTFSNTDLSSHQFRAQLNLNQQVGEDHEIVAIAGGEVRMMNNKRHGGGMYGFDEELLTYASNFDYIKQYPSLRGGSSSFGDLTSTPQHTTTHFLSMFGNAAYTYKKRYTLSTSARTDASNLFGLKTNDQWNPFYSFGLSWDISKEDFYHTSLFPSLRLRTTYGISGNINPAMTAVTTMQYNYGQTLFGTSYGMLNNYYNPELRWETAKQFNIGVDFSTKNQMLQGSIEYFHKQGTDLFGNALLDYTAGIGNSITKNVSSTKGNGLDINLNARLLDKVFKWRSQINYSLFRDEIVDYLLSQSTGYSYIARGGEMQQGKPVKVGKPVNSVFSYRWGGLDPETGDPIGYLHGEQSKDYSGIYSGSTVDELVYHGSSIPTHYGNWTNTFSYKKIELHVGLSFKMGYYFRRETIDYDNLAWQALGHSDFDRRWQKTGDELWTQVPSLDYPFNSYRRNIYQLSEATVEKGDHIRLQYVQLNYILQRKDIPFLPFRVTRFYLNANNLGILWKATKSGIDPDRSLGYSYFYSVPSSPSISVGVNINF